MNHQQRIAVIADAHFHDIAGDFGTAGITTPKGRLSLEPLGVALRSIRLRNESGAALRFALDTVQVLGIRDVMLLGDYTDDGQHPSVQGLAGILDCYRKHGLRFHAVPGNHDMFGPKGRHRSNRFLTDSGYDLVTSDAAAKDHKAAQTIVNPAMRCAGVAEALAAIPGLGYSPRESDVLWETPFGTNPDLPQRSYPVEGEHHVDASYLIEPIAGVWCLMIDANIFVPDGSGGWKDPTNAGWAEVLVHREYLLEWLTKVVTRAKVLNKALIAFSHYPAVDAMRGTGAEEREVFGDNTTVKRIPSDTVADALRAAGIRLHFSGHLHVNDISRYGPEDAALVNVAVPPLIGYPGAFKVVTVEDGVARVDNVLLDQMPLDPDITRAYAQEAERTGKGTHLIGHTEYGSFMDAHFRHLVPRRYLRRDWPRTLGGVLEGASLADLAAYSGAELSGLPAMPALQFLEDWYRLRFAGDLAEAAIPKQHMAAYRIIAEAFAHAPLAVPQSVAAQLGAVFSMFAKYAGGLPTGNIRVNLSTGEIRRANRD